MKRTLFEKNTLLLLDVLVSYQSFSSNNEWKKFTVFHNLKNLKEMYFEIYLTMINYSLENHKFVNMLGTVDKIKFLEHFNIAQRET